MVGYTGRADNQTITQLLCIFVPVNVVVAHSCTTLGNRSCFSASCDPEICLLPSVGGWKDMKLVSEPLIGNIGASESGRGRAGGSSSSFFSIGKLLRLGHLSIPTATFRTSVLPISFSTRELRLSERLFLFGYLCRCSARSFEGMLFLFSSYPAKCMPYYIYICNR